MEKAIKEMGMIVEGIVGAYGEDGINHIVIEWHPHDENPMRCAVKLTDKAFEELKSRDEQ